MLNGCGFSIAKAGNVPQIWKLLMQVGDLVRCLTAGDALGVIVERYVGEMYTVVLVHNDATCFIQKQYLELLS